MKKRIWEHKIPTWGAVIGLIIGLWATTYLVRSTIFIVSHASPDTTPQHITIAAISDTSFTVVYSTPAQTTGAVSVTKNGTAVVVGHDIRDKSAGNQGSYFSHSIVITGLTPSSQYQFSIVSGSSVYLNNGQSFTVTTAPSLDTSQNTNFTVSGSITMPNGDPATDAMVILGIPGAQGIAGITDSHGKYSFSTQSVRTADLASFLPVDSSTQGTLSFFSQTESATVRLLVAQSNQLPIITLDSNYDFTHIPTESAQVQSATGGLVLPTPNNSKRTIAISSPNPNAMLSDPRPLFQGLALPNQTVTITIHSDAAITTTVAADKNGLWSYRPPTNLPVGDHTITIATPNTFGIIQKITESFTVFASGVQVAQVATPSATPVFTPTVMASQTVTPTQILTGTPLPTVVQATPTAAVLPTDSPIPTAVAVFTPQPTIPPTGSSSTVVLTSISILFILSGASLLFLL